MAYFPKGKVAQNVWVCGSAQTSSAESSGLSYTALRHSQSDYIEFEFIAGSTGNVFVEVIYAMGGASGNACNIQLNRLVVSNGGNPATAATAGTAFNVTPGNATTTTKVTSADSTDFSFAVTEGDIVYCKFIRNGSAGGDTHTSDMKIYGVRVI